MRKILNQEMNENNIMGGVLAGGQSRRMGAKDKSLILLEHQTLISHVADRLSKQVTSMVINTNGDLNKYNDMGYPLVGDVIEGYAGPLAGIHALMCYTRKTEPNITHIATVAADTPFFPIDFVDRCVHSLKNEVQSETTIVLAMSGKNRHPVFGIWPVCLCDALEAFLKSSDTRKVMAFVQLHPLQFADFSLFELEGMEIDPFFNINRPDELLEAAAIYKKILSAEQLIQGNRVR